MQSLFSARTPAVRRSVLALLALTFTIAALGAYRTVGPGSKAGPQVTAPLPISQLYGTDVRLTGNVTYGGPTEKLTYKWSRVSGPGTVIFSDPVALSTGVTFSNPGTYLLKFESSDGARRSSQNTLVTVFAHAAHKVVSFSLIDSETDKPVPGYETLQNGATIKPASLPSSGFNLRANTSPAEVGSVRFLVDASPLSADIQAPYAIDSDSGGDYPRWAPSKKRYLVTAVPYAGGSGVESEGGALSLLLTFK